jgi:hypothetical protein
MRRTRTFIATALVLVLTALGITAAIAAGTGTVTPPPRTAFVARGDDPADALAIGPIAGRAGAPVFTTVPDVLVPEAQAALVAYAPDLVIIAGGTAAISNGVEAAIEAATGLPAGDVIRAAGANRFDTAAKAADLIAAYNPAFLPVEATATDSDLLDGLDSTAFVTTSDVAGLIPVAVVNIDAAGVLDASSHRAPVAATPVVTKSGVGIYDVDLPGVGFRFDSDAATCTLNSGSTPGDLAINSIGGNDLRVFTFNAAGAAADRPFHCAIHELS